MPILPGRQDIILKWPQFHRKIVRSGKNEDQIDVVGMRCGGHETAVNNDFSYGIDLQCFLQQNVEFLEQPWTLVGALEDTETITESSSEQS